MSSGFISGGTIDAPIERSDAWLAAQTELEASRARKAAEAAQQQNGRSLFETLEANKAAKQDAFTEAARLKNQFRSLDEDEVEFLDSVLESTRAEEARVRRETREGLDVFRKAQEEVEKRAREGEGGEEGVGGGGGGGEGEWVAGGARKRKRRGEREGLRGVKVRRASSTGDLVAASPATRPSVEKERDPASIKRAAEELPQKQKPSPKPSKPISKSSQAAPPSAPPKPVPKPGLVDYGSDEDDDW